MFSKIINNFKFLKKVNIHLFGLIFFLLNFPLLLLSLIFPNKFKREGIYFCNHFYKGSGGPNQKINLLISYFGEKYFNFKTIYIVSGSQRFPLYILNFYRILKVQIIINQNGVFFPAWYKKKNIKYKNRYFYRLNNP